MRSCKLFSGATMPVLGLGTWRMGESPRRRAGELDALKYGLDLGYPIFSRGRYMRTGKDRVEVESMQQPISLGEIQVRPGDILVGDADGILVVPRVRETEVFETAREIEDAEQGIERETAKGLRLDEARKAFRYHQLQTHA